MGLFNVRRVITCSCFDADTFAIWHRNMWYSANSGLKFSVLAALLCANSLPVAHAQQSQQPPAANEKKAPKLDLEALSKQAGKPEEPKSALALALKDGYPKNAVKRAKVRDNLYALLATAAEKKEADKVLAALNRLYLTSGSPTIDLLMKRGIKSITGKKLEGSLKYLDAVIDLAPDYAEGWNRRAYVYYRKNQFRRAAGDLRRVLALDPNHFRALEGLGSILRDIGDEKGALEVFEKLVGIHPFWKGTDSVYKELKKKVEGRGI